LRNPVPDPDPGCPFCTYADTDSVVVDEPLCFACVSTDPINRHHVIVLPKLHYTTLSDVPDDLAAALLRLAMTVSRAVRRVAHPDAITHVSEDDFSGGYNLAAHTKIHVIPRFRADLRVIDWSPLRRPATQEERSNLAAEIRSHM
jgi:histidine triad (HIT) family protein